MRWFWGLMLLAVVAAAVLLVVRRQAPAPQAVAANNSAQSGAIDSRPPRPNPQPANTEPASSSALPTPTTVDVAPKQASEVRPIESPATSPIVAAKPVDPAALVLVPTELPKAENAAVPLVGPPRPLEDEAARMREAVEAAVGVGGGGKVAVSAPEEMGPPISAKPAVQVAAKAKLTPREDGSTLVDDRFVIKGVGSKDDPYLISWEMLVSAQDSYQPRLGRKLIPDRLKMMDGKWIKIAGYIAFPMMAQSQDEMLMMLNQWDGCCIGVPPTPYDAIEVKLKSAAKGDDRLRMSGSVRGILRVDPYLVKDWLVSLYLMDDAELNVDAGSGKRIPTAVQGHLPTQ